MNKAMKRELADKLHFAQKGSTSGRHFLDNVVEIDMAARRFGMATAKKGSAMYDTRGLCDGISACKSC